MNAKILRTMIVKLVAMHGHVPTCRFTGCTCGIVAVQRAVLIEANKLLRETENER